MARKKLLRFEEIAHMPNVLVFTEPGFAKNARARLEGRPIMLELACGRGEYTITMAQRFPRAMCVGIDLKGDRLWHGATRACAERLDNALFVRMNIENIATIIPAHCVEDLWITFPDPFPRKRHVKKRLTSPRFLALYASLLSPNACVHLKTDSDSLFAYTISILRAYDVPVQCVIRDTRVRGETPGAMGVLGAKDESISSSCASCDSCAFRDAGALVDVRTTYEQRHRALGRAIHYLAFQPQRAPVSAHLQNAFGRSTLHQ